MYVASEKTEYSAIEDKMLRLVHHTKWLRTGNYHDSIKSSYIYLMAFLVKAQR